MTITPPKTNMDTQNDGLEKVDSFKIWQFLVSMLDFWGVLAIKNIIGISAANLPLIPYFRKSLICFNDGCFWEMTPWTRIQTSFLVFKEPQLKGIPQHAFWVKAWFLKWSFSNHFLLMKN